ncbi:MAG: cation transporter [Actinomycetota bacterium]
MPVDRQHVQRKAIRLEWITLIYMLSATVLLYLTLGSSQAMKTAWLDDILSFLPPIAFLLADRWRDRPPNSTYPYGFHRGVSLGFLVAAAALFVMGFLLLLDSLMQLISFDHPSIGMITLFGRDVWLGWVMLLTLAWSGFPAAALGRVKLPLAHELHDKILYADAYINKANWLTAAGAMVGVLGIGFGVWWTDAVAASLIAADILHDGIMNLRVVVADLMDKVPRRIDGQMDPLVARIESELEALSWVKRARARLREQGHVYFGEVFVVPRDQRRLVAHLDEATELVKTLDWKLHDVVIRPTARIGDEEEELGLKKPRVPAKRADKEEKPEVKKPRKRSSSRA